MKEEPTNRFKKGLQCRATSKRTKEQCKLPAMKGGVVCKFHGGYTPGHRVKAAVMAEKPGRGYGQPLEIDPAMALLNQVYEAAGNVAYLRMLVQELEESKLTGPIGNPEYYMESKPNVLIVMYDAERDRLTRISKMCLDIGIAERQIRVAEAYGEVLVSVIKALLDDPRMELTGKQREVGKLVAGEQFRQLAVAGVESRSGPAGGGEQTES